MNARFVATSSSGSSGSPKTKENSGRMPCSFAFAARAKEHGILPEFSFVFGDPEDPEDDVATNLAFIERLAAVNPDLKLIAYFYTPTPQRRGTYGDVDPLSATPATLEEWTTPEWLGWMTHEDPRVPWLPRRLKERVEDFARRLKGGLVPADSQAYGHLREAG